MSPLSSGLRAVADVLDAHPQIVGRERHSGHYVTLGLFFAPADLVAVAAELGASVVPPRQIKSGMSYARVTVSRGPVDLELACSPDEWRAAFPPAVTA